MRLLPLDHGSPQHGKTPDHGGPLRGKDVAVHPYIDEGHRHHGQDQGKEAGFQGPREGVHRDGHAPGKGIVHLQDIQDLRDDVHLHLFTLVDLHHVDLHHGLFDHVLTEVFQDHRPGILVLPDGDRTGIGSTPLE